MTELSVLGRSGSDGADALATDPSPVAAGTLEDIVTEDGIVVVDAAAVEVSASDASVTMKNCAPAVPARSHGLGGEAVVILDHLCPHSVVFPAFE
jgi:hypothetical protein